MERHQGYLIVRVPTDGNCLFSSLVSQIISCRVWCSEYHIYAKRLREEIVQYIRLNLAKYQISVLGTAKERWPESTDDNQLILSFLDELSQEGTWGGEEVLQAVAELYEAKIEVYQLNTTPIVFGVSFRQVFRVLYLNNNHYDGLFDVNSPVLPSVHPALTGRIRRVQTDTSSFRLQRDNSISQATTMIGKRTSFCVATWNVRGSCQSSKQAMIDEALVKVSVDLVALQETNSVATQIDSANYTWYLSHIRRVAPLVRNYGVRNGVGILVRRNCGIQVRYFEGISERLCFAFIMVKGLGELLVICVHFQSNFNMTSSHMLSRKISNLIRKYSKSRTILVMGDFNAHVGLDQVSLSRQGLIGKNVYHSDTNERGDILVELAIRNNLTLCTTFGRRSCLVTWEGPNSSSQLDHILFGWQRSKLRIKSNSLKGTFADKFPIKVRGRVVRRYLSDHKLVFGRVYKSASNFRKLASISLNPHGNYEDRDCRHWRVELLRNSDVLEQFRSSVVQCLTQDGLTLNGELCISSTTSIEDIWRGFVHSLKVSSNLVLAKEPVLTRGQKASMDALALALKRKPHNPHVIKNCRFHVRQEFRKSKQDKCRDFFRNLNDISPFNRLRQTYQFIRSFRQNSDRFTSHYIPLSAWEQILINTSGTPVSVVSEKDHWPLRSPPTRDELEAVLFSIRRGTAPGLDELPIELLQSLPEEGMKVFLYVLQQVWLLNHPPAEWLETIQFPLPKRRQPNTITDYRRITLSDTGYRVYAKLLLGRIEDIYVAIGSYQAAFLRNRSADDHMFVLRRVLDEEWRAGRTVYVLSLDLKQAFDTVNLNQAAIILSHIGLPHHLVNRVIRTCMHEVSSIIWCRQRTKSFQRGVGLKQGCPISPTLFNLVIDAVMITLAEVVPGLCLNQDLGIKLPMILAYADDILLISNDLASLSTILSELVPLLSSVGLQVNGDKSEILIRPPNQSIRTLMVGGMSFRISTILRYLGTYLTAGHNRQETIRKRYRQAQGIVHMLSRFIREHRIPCALVIQMYRQLVTPVMTYGLRVAVLTKASRLRLARYEKSFLVQMLQYCSERPRRVCIREILAGKTINRKVTAYRIYYWGHILRRSRGHLLHAAKRYLIGYKKIGRPIFTWHDSVKYDLQKMPISKSHLKTAAKTGKGVLKREVDKIYDSVQSSSNESDDFVYSSDSN